MIGRRDRWLGYGAAAPSIRVLGLVIAATLAAGSASGAREQTGATLPASPLNIGLRVELRPSLAVLRVDAALTFEARDARVLRLYFGLQGEREHTLEEIGNMLGVTRERIRQLRDRALRRLREGNMGDALESFAA